MTPEISVCLPVYQGERWLPACLASVLEQEWGGFELVIADDGSTDRSLELCSAVRDPRVRVLEPAAHQGLAGSWNRCIRACTGRFVKYLAQDDLLAPGALGAFARAVGEQPQASFFFSACERIDERGERLGWHTAPLAAGPHPPEALLRMLFAEGNRIGGPTNTLVRAGAFAEAGWFDPRCRYALDWVMWVQLARRFGGVHLAEPLVAVRQHRGSETERLLAEGTTWWDFYQALRVLREREPALAGWLRAARRDHLARLPGHLLREALQRRRLPRDLPGQLREVFRDGLW